MQPLVLGLFLCVFVCCMFSVSCEVVTVLDIRFGAVLSGSGVRLVIKALRARAHLLPDWSASPGSAGQGCSGYLLSTFSTSLSCRVWPDLKQKWEILSMCCRLHRGAALQTVGEVQRPAGAVVLRVLQKLEQEEPAAVRYPTP